MPLTTKGTSADLEIKYDGKWTRLNAYLPECVKLLDRPVKTRKKSLVVPITTTDMWIESNSNGLSKTELLQKGTAEVQRVQMLRDTIWKEQQQPTLCPVNPAPCVRRTQSEWWLLDTRVQRTQFCTELESITAEFVARSKQMIRECELAATGLCAF